MNDQELLHHIETLVSEEHTLLQHEDHSQLTPAQHERIKQLEISLDQCWDLLRQRRAKREFGLNPEETQLRDPGIVEHYKQ